MRIILCGSGGRMGHAVKELVANGYRNSVIVASVDISNQPDPANGVFCDINDFKGDADCIIDFSFHTATAGILSYAESKGIPVVICTTGHSPEETDRIHKSANHIAVFRSANMSLGIAVLANLAKKAALMFPDADIEIIETHHNQKADAPSGTALLIANELADGFTDTELVLGRNGMGKRKKGEIGIHAVRAGSEVGDHKIIIATDTQVLTLEHRACSRALFAEGAIDAACFISDKAEGMYDMKSIVSPDLTGDIR